MMKKISLIFSKGFLPVALAVLLAASSVGFAGASPQAEVQADAQESNMEFYRQAGSLVKNNWENNYFSAIIIDLQEDTITVDDNKPVQLEQPIILEEDLLNIKNEQELKETVSIPVLSILQAQGQQVAVDKENGQIILQDEHDKTQVEIEDENLLEAFESEVEGLEKSIKQGEYTTGAVMSAQQVEEAFSYQVLVSDTKLVVTNPYQTKRLIVCMKSANEIGNTFGAVQAVTDNTGRYLLQYATEEETRLAYEKLRENEEISVVSQDKVLKAGAVASGSANDWGKDRINSQRYMAHLANNKKTDKVVVAVLDTGVDGAHPHLKNRVLEGYDLVYYDDKQNDAYGHGTLVSGVITNNCPSSVKILPIKVLDDEGYGAESTVGYGVECAVADGADIINMSLGGVCEETGYLERVIDQATQKGKLVVVAAGNENIDTDIMCPAHVESAVTVSATNQDDSRAYFSNYGKAVDIAAPGSEIYSCSVGDGYGYFDGTSLSAPFVSAAAAMLKINQPNITIDQWNSQLESSSVDLVTKGKDIYFGYGVLNLGKLLGDNVPAASFTLSQNDVTVEKRKYYYTEDVYLNVGPGNATDKSVTITSSAPHIAEYDGVKIIAKSAGTAVITVTLPNGKKQACKVTVTSESSWLDYAAQGYAGGTGTESDPYLIETAGQLARLAQEVIDDKAYTENACYVKQIADIDLGGKEWYPISYRRMVEDLEVFPTAIYYDGANHEIRNMTTSYSGMIDGYYNGLFGYNMGDIRNLHLKDVDVNGDLSVGALVGKADDCVIENCTVTGRIVGGNEVGGLVGMSEHGLRMNQVSMNGEVEAFYGQAGGLIGTLIDYDEDNINIQNSYADVNVKSYAIGGGLVGFLAGGKAINSYSSGALKEPGFELSEKDLPLIGGIQDSQVINCFSTGIFAGTFSGGEINNCYYQREPVIYDDFFGGEDVQKGLNKKSADFFKNEDNFTTNKDVWDNSYEWDFDTIWQINGKNLPKFIEQVPNTLNLRVEGKNEVGQKLAAYYDINKDLEYEIQQIYWQCTDFTTGTWKTIQSGGEEYTVIPKDSQRLMRVILSVRDKFGDTKIMVYQLPQRTVYYGDVDGDGEIAVDDVLMAQKSIAMLITLDEAEFACADVDKSGNLDMRDILYIQKYVALIINKFPTT